MEEHHIVDGIVLIAALGIGAHWLAWRFRLPVIVLLTAAGLAAGPGLGLVRPQEQFGDLLQPMIGLAVAVILFEGGLHLLLKDLRGIETPVRRLVVIGAAVTWGLGAASAQYLAGVSWPVALLLGGILVVTGPTVIIPLLMQAKLDRETASVLKWEGIVNDPLGALLAVLVFEYITVADGATARVLAVSTAGIVGAGAVGFAAGRGFAWLHGAGHVAEYLKGPFILGLTLVCYLAGNTLQAEAGLVAVTVLGMTLANAGLADIDQMRRLKEYVTVILVSGLFIVLSASLEPAVLGRLDWGTLAFVCAVLFVVRPASVFVATLGTGLSWRQRLFVGWIAPRGIVAVSMAGLFAGLLVEDGFPDGDQLVPLVFSIVLATVVLHGSPWARSAGFWGWRPARRTAC
jgi:NhaP-type Na+/H+ or K+/H+ antiporter